MKILINYANLIYNQAQLKNCISGFESGGFNAVIKYRVEHIDSEFYNKNKHILDLERGAGYWLWKPYFIKKTMIERMNEDDILFYCDAGHQFYNSIDHLIPLMENTKQKMLATNTGQISKKFTKRDTFYYMNSDSEFHHNCDQIQATFILLKKNKFTLNFIDEWLEYSQDYRLITDSPNECGLQNFDEFVDHRHDQSIFSILANKYGITSILPPDQYNYNNPNKEVQYQIINYIGRKNTE